MDKVAIDDLKDGMLIAETILGEHGKPLIIEGTKLTKTLIDRLTQMPRQHIYIYHEQTIEADPGAILINRVFDYCQRVLDNHLPMNLYKHNNTQALEKHDRVNRILEGTTSDPRVAEFYLDLRTVAPHFLEHSLNVSVFALLVGVSIGLSDEMLDQLAIGAILHDIGYLNLPKNLVNQKDLTPQELKNLEEHTKLGYKYLREKGFSTEVARIALYHHEKWDGSGYPTKLVGEKADLLSRIVGVADVYDSFTGIIAKERYLPHEAIEYLYGAGDYLFDARLVKAFIQNVPIYPLGSVVRLSTGEVGVVVNVEKNVSPRPIIKICYDKENQKLPYPKQIDLSVEKTVFIKEVLW
ncbi:MAG: HD domain-containing protein [Clostridia bacterium]|nr:HD domain-containing protein [Clostridia bacterium]